MDWFDKKLRLEKGFEVRKLTKTKDDLKFDITIERYKIDQNWIIHMFLKSYATMILAMLGM